jgi:hypothetical protein
MLERVGLNDAAIVAIEAMGLTSIESFNDLTDDDIPAIIKEIRRRGTPIRQSSQNFLHALRYWVVRQERMQENYLSDDFTDNIMRHALRRWQIASESASNDLIKAPKEFKTSSKWRKFKESFLTFLQHTKGHCDFPLSYVLREEEVLAEDDERPFES